MVTARNLFQWACSINGNSEAWWQVRKLAYFIHNLLRHSFITKEDSEEVVCIWKRYPKYHQSLYFNCVENVAFHDESMHLFQPKTNGLSSREYHRVFFKMFMMLRITQHGQKWPSSILLFSLCSTCIAQNISKWY